MKTIDNKIKQFNDLKARNKNNRKLGAHYRLPQIDKTGLWTDGNGYLYTEREGHEVNQHPLLHGAQYCWPIY